MRSHKFHNYVPGGFAPKRSTIEYFASSTRAAEDKTRWKGIVVKSSVLPQRSRKDIHLKFHMNFDNSA